MARERFIEMSGDTIEAIGLELDTGEKITEEYGARVYGLFNADGHLVGIAQDAGNDNYDVTFFEKSGRLRKNSAT